MKKILLTSAAILSIGTSISSAQIQSGIINVSSVNVRNGPSTSYGVKFVLHKNQNVKIIGSSNGWTKISDQYNREGWVYSKYIGSYEYAQNKFVTAYSLNVRSGPSTSYRTLGYLRKGESVDVISTKNGWAKIKYNKSYAYVSEKYLSNQSQQIEGSTIKYVNTTGLNIRSGPSTSYRVLSVYKKGTKVEVVSIKNGWAKIKYNGSYAYTYNKYLSESIVNGDSNSNNNYNSNNSSNNNSNNNQSNTSYTNLNCTFEQMVDYEYKLSQKGYNRISANLSSNYQNSSKYINATKEDLRKYLDPNTFSTNKTGRLQFLRVDKYREGITSSELDSFFNRYCPNNSVFRNKGNVFISAAKKYNLDVSYLVAASMVETGYGRSELAQGVYVTSPCGKKVKVYNFFGISAYDGTAVLSASNYAYKMGWTTVDKTIDGCAKWISQNYVHSSKYNQNTLYKMRWNYNSGHQYATDVNWANIIACVMNNITPYYGSSVSLNYELPRYK